MPLVPIKSAEDVIAEALATPGDAYISRLENAAERGHSRGQMQAAQILWRRHQRLNSLAPRRGARYDPSNPWESIEQADVADYLDAHPANLLWAHIPNERHGKRAAGILAAQGVKPGVPDIMIWTPPASNAAVGVAIELKRRKAPPSALQPTQRAWLAALREHRWLAVCCRGAGPACALIDALWGKGWLP
jgi:hypothetical protein